MTLPHLGRKGIVWSTLITIILLIVGFTSIIYWTEVFFSKAEGAASEQLCRTTNAVYANADPLKNLPLSLNLRATPEGCKSNDVNDVPTGKYTQDNQGAMKNVADLMSRCWWMFLEGRTSELLGARGFFGPDKKTKCFACSYFTLQKGMAISELDLELYLKKSVYRVQDASDRCSMSGGICKRECSMKTEKDPEGLFTAAKATGVCAQKERGTQCCTAQDECVNKGGRCLSGPQGDFIRTYDGWSCSQGTCFVRRGNYMTYQDYIETAGGEGYIALGDRGSDTLQLTAGNQGYAVIFLSDLQSSIWKSTFVRLMSEAIGIADTYGMSGIAVVPVGHEESTCYVQNEGK